MGVQVNKKYEGIPERCNLFDQNLPAANPRLLTVGSVTQEFLRIESVHI